MGSIYVQALGANAMESQTTCAGLTASAAPINLAMVDLADGASMLASILVVARRTDTGASKAWNGVALIKRIGAVVTVEEGTGGAPADAYCSAGDTTPMAGCTIALATSGTTAGVQCTGPAGVTVQWAAVMRALIVF